MITKNEIDENDIKQHINRVLEKEKKYIKWKE